MSKLQDKITVYKHIFLYSSNEQSENKIIKTISFAIAMKKNLTNKFSQKGAKLAQ